MTHEKEAWSLSLCLTIANVMHERLPGNNQTPTTTCNRQLQANGVTLSTSKEYTTICVYYYYYYFFWNLWPVLTLVRCLADVMPRHVLVLVSDWKSDLLSTFLMVNRVDCWLLSFWLVYLRCVCQWSFSLFTWCRLSAADDRFRLSTDVLNTGLTAVYLSMGMLDSPSHCCFIDPQ